MASEPRSRRFLPGDPRVEEPYRLTPQLALRVAILGVRRARRVRGALPAALGAPGAFRARSTSRRRATTASATISVDAPRGRIVDRHGPSARGERRRNEPRASGPPTCRGTARRGSPSCKALSMVASIPVKEIVARMKPYANDPLTPVVLRRGIQATSDQYLTTSRSISASSPASSWTAATSASYPYKSLLAQALGYVGPISPAQVKAAEKAGYQPQDVMGQAGIEQSYDRYLKGKDGVDQSHGELAGPADEPDQADGRSRRRGTRLRLTIDIRLQRAAERALASADPGRARRRRDLRRRRRDRRARPAQRRRPRDGVEPDLPAVGLREPRRRRSSRRSRTRRSPRRRTHPSLEPRDRRLLPAGVGVEAGDGARGDAGGDPLADREPPVHAELHLLPADLPQLGSLRRPADGARPGARRVVRHLLLPGRRSGSTTCRRTAARRCSSGPRASGSAPTTGIDIGPENAGLVPTPDWRCRHFGGPPCAGYIDRIWKPGYEVQLAIGQGDLEVTPIQMARFYAMIANGGQMVTPHMAQDVEHVDGRPEPAAGAARARDAAGHAERRRPGVRSRPSSEGLYARHPLRVRHLVRRLRAVPGPDRRARRARPRRT